MSRKVINRDIQFIDQHNVRIKTVLELPYNSNGEGEGTAEQIIDETKPVKVIREAQVYNVGVLADTNAKIRQLEKVLASVPELNSRQQALLEDLKVLRNYETIEKQKGMLAEQIQNRKSIIDAMVLCGDVLKKRQELYPDSSVEPIDSEADKILPGIQAEAEERAQEAVPAEPELTGVEVAVDTEQPTQ